MKRFIAPALVAALLLTTMAMAPSSPAKAAPVAAAAAAQQDVTFTPQEQHIVMVDGVSVASYSDRSAAEADAAARKRANSGAVVGYFTSTLNVASLGPVDPTPTPTPTPTAPQNGPLVWGYDATEPASNWSRPALYTPYVDPAYNTTITRVTSADGTRFNRNTYSRRQAENSSGTMFMTYHGDAAYHVYNRADGSLVRALDIGPGAEPQWHPTNPNIVRHIAGDNSYVGDLRLYEVNVTSGASTVIADLASRIRSVFPTADYLQDRDEGSPSRDGNRYSWLIYDSSETIIGIVSYDLASNSLLGSLTAAQFPDAGPIDALSTSPTGDYVIVNHWEGTYVYDADMTNRRLVFAGAEHSDIALNKNGRDAYVYIDFTSGPEGGWLVSVDLDTLTHSLIFDLYDDANTSIHISGKGYNKPGWVVASTYSCKVPGGAWSCEKVMAVELVPNGRVLNLAHTYNCGESYWTETHASVNRDFTRVYFNTDSGSCGIDAEVSIIDVPSFDVESSAFTCQANGGVLTWTNAGQAKYWVYKSTNGGLTYNWIGRTRGNPAPTTFTDQAAVNGARYQVHYQGIPRENCN